MFRSSQNENVNFSDACYVDSCPEKFWKNQYETSFFSIGVLLLCEAIGVFFIFLTIFAFPEMDAGWHVKSKPLTVLMVLFCTKLLLLLAKVFYSLADGVILADCTKVMQLNY